MHGGLLSMAMAACLHVFMAAAPGGVNDNVDSTQVESDAVLIRLRLGQMCF